MEELLNAGRSVVSEYFGDAYVFGEGVLENLGTVLTGFGEGKRISLIMSSSDQEWNKKIQDKIKLSLLTNGIQIHGGIIRAARVGAPSDDIIRIATTLEELEPQVVVCVGGESALNAGKIANIYWRLKDKSPRLEDLEGDGKISELIGKLQRHVAPFVAVGTSISSSHLTTEASIYSLSEKRLLRINDELVRPSRSLFDSRWLIYLPAERVRDGAIEALSNCLEGYLCYQGEYDEYVEYICLLGMELILRNSQAAMDEDNFEARSAVALATDISGIARMTSARNCGHLNFYSSVGDLNRIQLCAVLNLYYLVLYSQGIGEKLVKIAKMMKRCGFDPVGEGGDVRGLSESVSEEMKKYFKSLQIPVSLSEFKNFTEANAMTLMEEAKKELAHRGFSQIPVELNLINVNKYLRLLYQAAYTGDYAIIVNP